MNKLVKYGLVLISLTTMLTGCALDDDKVKKVKVSKISDVLKDVNVSDDTAVKNATYNFIKEYTGVSSPEVKVVQINSKKRALIINNVLEYDYTVDGTIGNYDEVSDVVRRVLNSKEDKANSREIQDDLERNIRYALGEHIFPIQHDEDDSLECEEKLSSVTYNEVTGEVTVETNVGKSTFNKTTK